MEKLFSFIVCIYVIILLNKRDCRQQRNYASGLQRISNNNYNPYEDLIGVYEYRSVGHNQNAIQPMSNTIERFSEPLPGDYQYIQHSNDLFGDETEEDGNYSADSLSLPSNFDNEENDESQEIEDEDNHNEDSEQQYSYYSAEALSLPSDSEWDDDDDSYHGVNNIYSDEEDGYDAEHEDEIDNLSNFNGDEVNAVGDELEDEEDGYYSADNLSLPSDWDNDEDSEEESSGYYSADALSLPSDWEDGDESRP